MPMTSMVTTNRAATGGARQRRAAHVRPRCTCRPNARVIGTAPHAMLARLETIATRCRVRCTRALGRTTGYVCPFAVMAGHRETLTAESVGDHDRVVFSTRYFAACLHIQTGGGAAGIVVNPHLRKVFGGAIHIRWVPLRSKNTSRPNKRWIPCDMTYFICGHAALQRSKTLIRHHSCGRADIVPAGWCKREK